MLIMNTHAANVATHILAPRARVSLSEPEKAAEQHRHHFFGTRTARSIRSNRIISHHRTDRSSSAIKQVNVVKNVRIKCATAEQPPERRHVVSEGLERCS